MVPTEKETYQRGTTRNVRTSQGCLGMYPAAWSSFHMDVKPMSVCLRMDGTRAEKRWRDA